MFCHSEPMLNLGEESIAKEQKNWILRPDKARAQNDVWEVIGFSFIFATASMRFLSLSNH